VTLDAFPDTSYAGTVTEIGNSPIVSTSATGLQGVDFEVTITLTEDIGNVRPGLSADSEIIVAERDSVLSIPIQSLTVRREKDLRTVGETKAGARAKADSASSDEGGPDIEGVFVVEGDHAHFRPVKIGISSQKYFEVLSGLSEGEAVVSGNFKAIRELRNGQRVSVTKEAKKR
jgi:HlyD family secretion protein